MAGKIIRTLSVKQPWASLLLLGEKRHETRSWATEYRGLLAIHASAAFGADARALCREEPFGSVLTRHGFTAPMLPTAAVVGVARLLRCVPVEDANLTEQEEAFGDFSPGRFAWEMEVVERFPMPFPAKGSLGLWGWKAPLELERRLKL